MLQVITLISKNNNIKNEMIIFIFQDQNTAILLEESAPDIFRIKLGQLKAGSGAIIKLTYISELPVEDRAVRLTVPTTVAPRYIPPSDNSPEAKEIAKIGYKHAHERSTPLAINIGVLSQAKINKIHSPSHNLKIELKGEETTRNGQYAGKAVLGDAFSRTDILDRDLVVLIEAEENSKPVVFLEKDNKNKSLAAMLSLVPSFRLDEQPVELIFLVDRSGSMGGSSMEQAKAALSLFLHSIPAGCHFNIVSFGSRHEFFFKRGSRLYDDHSLAEAKRHVAGMDANFGGTEIFSPLQAIYNSKIVEGKLRQIFILTDGDVSNSYEVINLVTKNSRNTRVFALGLGASASRHLVKGVARSGNGMAVFSTLTEDLRPKVMTLLKNSLQPALTDVRVLWGDEKDTHPVGGGTGSQQKSAEPEVETKRTLLGFMKPKPPSVEGSTKSPPPGSGGSEYPPIFDGSRFLVYKMFTGNAASEAPAKVTIKAMAPDGPLDVSLDITEDRMLEDGCFVHQLAARKKIQELEEEAQIRGYGYFGGERPSDNKEAITALALNYGLASKYTSFVGVDRATRKDWFEPAMSTRYVKQEVPYGYGGGYVKVSPKFYCDNDPEIKLSKSPDHDSPFLIPNSKYPFLQGQIYFVLC